MAEEQHPEATQLESEDLRTVVSQLSARDHSALGRTAVALERVFAFFISLAMAEAARRSIALVLGVPVPVLSTPREIPINDELVLLTFAALLGTLIPFYHGGFSLIDQRARYYRLTSVSMPAEVTRLRLRAGLNFLALFIEGSILFTAAMSVTLPKLFTKSFILLFALDGLWVAYVWLFASRKLDDERQLVGRWGMQSAVACAVTLGVYLVFKESPRSLAIAVSIALLLRTAWDYWRNGEAYFDHRPVLPAGLPEKQIVVQRV
jgi:hypothetical protein